MPEAQKEQYMDAILTASSNLSLMVTNILKLNKLENQRIFPAPESYPLGEQLRQIPILFVTALDDFPSKQKGFSAGVDDYMVKPVDMDENRDGFELRLGAGIARVRRFQRALYHQCGP